MPKQNHTMKKIYTILFLLPALSGLTQSASTGKVSDPYLVNHAKTYNTCSYMQEGNAFQDGYQSNTFYNIVISDDFIVPDGECWTITDVMTSFFTSNIADISAMEVAFYADNTGAPGTVLSHDTVPVAAITSTYAGSNYGYDIYHHTMSLSDGPELCGGVGGTTYWVSFQVVNTNSSYFWECTYLSTYGANSKSASSELGPWGAQGYDYVFEIFHGDVTNLNLTECNGFSITVGSNTYNSSGVYHDTLTNVNGCDSIVHLDLTIIPIDNSVTQTGVQLESNEVSVGATYQWLNCNNGFAPVVSGGTNATYTSAVNGSFAVEVTANGCTDTSSCFLIDYTGLNENVSVPVVLYPNPTKNTTSVSGLNALNGFERMIITSSTGAAVATYTTAVSTLDLSELANGVYFVNIYHSEGQMTLRLIKE